jgi:hypothetical protein
MLKKTIKFKDLEGNEHTKDFYFHLKKDLLVELEIVHEGGFKEKLQGIIASKNGRAIMDAFKEIVAMSYGEKSADGMSFLQSKERSEWFMGTDAYSEFFFELVTNATFASDFINGIMPSNIEQEAARLEAEMKRAGLNTAPDNTQDKATSSLPTPAEMANMTKEDLENVFARIRAGELSPVQPV